MNPDHWQRIKTIVHAVLPLPESEREEYITFACRDDEALHEEIERLLISIEKSEKAKFMDRLELIGEKFVSDLSEKWMSVSSQKGLIGEQIGPYTITQLLGTGGMGSVFKAERSDGKFHQTVAIKLIRKGVDSEENIRRFRMEQEILARLHHPNIAQLYDGGLTEDGAPYLVMEFVDGTPIDEYCNEQQLMIGERIDLFKDVCLAVQHAHNNLIVHRDLKTKNIYVTRDGVVKILDFGVSKLLRPELTDITLLETRPDQKFWTPQYAAPEQVRGEAVTTATDVYALGILLHKLLTDTWPLDLQGKDLPEIERTILQTPPIPPSQSFKSGTLIKECANRRKVSPSELQKSLSGDIDALVLKSIRKEPGYRYRSAEQLLDDIERYQKRLPLQARKGTIRYRLTKFVKRNKAVLAAACLFLTLAGGLGFYHVYQMAEQRDTAQREAAKARAAQDYLVELFEAADPAENQGEQMTAREIVQRGIDRLEGDLVDEPEVHIEMLKVLGRVEQALGDFDLSAELLEQALTKTRELRGEAHLDVAAVAAMLGEVLRWDGELDRAERLFREALTIRRRFIEGDDAQAAENMDRLARTLEMRGDFGEAETLYRDALAMRERLFGENSEEVAANLNNLGWLLHQMGKIDDAEQTLRRALELRYQIMESPNPAISSTLSNLAVVLSAKGDYREAEDFAERALQQEIELHGKDHPRVTTAMSNRSLILLSQARYKEAAGQYRLVLENNRRQLGPTHVYVGIDLSLLSTALIEDGRSEEALPLIEEALEIFRNAVGEEHRYYAKGLIRLGDALTDQDPRHAATVLEQAIDIFRRVVGPDHPDVAGTLTRLGRVRLALGEVEEAEAALRTAHEIQREALPSPHASTAWTLTILGQVLTVQDRPGEAESLLREAAKISAGSLPPGHWRQMATQLELAVCLIAGGQVTLAQSELEQVLTVLQDKTDYHSIQLYERALELQNRIAD